jgi:hypothetical protein
VDARFSYIRRQITPLLIFFSKVSEISASADMGMQQSGHIRLDKSLLKGTVLDYKTLNLMSPGGDYIRVNEVSAEEIY